MVLCVPDTLLQSEQLDNLIHDLTLLSHLGIRLVLGFGLRSQVESRLAAKQKTTQVANGMRVTDDAALQEILTIAGRVRTQLEARLSMGLPNTPMAGARLSVCSGNFITAQPYGIHGGLDYQHTGSVRQVHSAEIKSQLTNGNIVILPPLGYSLTGDVFNLAAQEVATQTAIALRADKLLFLVPTLPVDEQQHTIHEASVHAMEQALTQQHDEVLVRTLKNATHAARNGVDRVHLLDMNDPNALLRELFTRDGGSTLITAKNWEHLRQATAQDVNGIIELITPLQENGALAYRTREQLELDIDSFIVCEREGMIIACAALFIAHDKAGDEKPYAEIACVATHPDYRGQGRAGELIAHLENKARTYHVGMVMLLSTRAAHWFIEQGYAEATPQDLPKPRAIEYDKQRNSKVFTKRL